MNVLSHLLRSISVPLLVCGYLLHLPSTAWAGDIYGSIRTADGSKRAQVTVEITVSGNGYSATTSAPGAYRVHVEQTGHGSLRLLIDGVGSDPVDVYSFTNPVQFNLVLEPRQGAYGLRQE